MSTFAVHVIRHESRKFIFAYKDPLPLTVKQAFSALRRLFDWLVIDQAIATSPAQAVRGPMHSVQRGKTPVLSPEQVRELLTKSSVR